MSKLFSNVIPNDTARTVRRSTLIYCQQKEKWKEVRFDGIVWTPHGRYVFVRLDGVLFARRATAVHAGVVIGHLDLSRGENVTYAGEIFFKGHTKRGCIRLWTNASGHYKPDPEYACQAGLPIDLFSKHNFSSSQIPWARVY
jgi:hypothetical protein